jgi:hypothetical protein
VTSGRRTANSRLGFVVGKFIVREFVGLGWQVWFSGAAASGYFKTKDEAVEEAKLLDSEGRLGNKPGPIKDYVRAPSVASAGAANKRTWAKTWERLSAPLRVNGEPFTEGPEGGEDL